MTVWLIMNRKSEAGYGEADVWKIKNCIDNAEKNDVNPIRIFIEQAAGEQIKVRR